MSARCCFSISLSHHRFFHRSGTWLVCAKYASVLPTLSHLMNLLNSFISPPSFVPCKTFFPQSPRRAL
ncbi:hypothetical protein HBI56_182950 [Parastagonospora nodorum]|uniref:Uncharacterized protein n=1 Tax=Phaeosphaeria nodorum (strain SN15 / ATCC MYA-4574 / FGSC 10173) TaxID=321614 RepID=A0A7U2FD77_PHANO|nr:hypothetical protein HBH56_191430 [Parastagonospora nodorum]QRD03113.1 hypothetical protein JI435_419170 [Parastagonospora nodorum SN15]KAH3937872.1 hypothetical protein HBH54_010570 [Parastagonospora nodorum]KAH3940701.1 hypothetical protein HBH53_211770 [Parastagonospora nodorum]KAH3966512.1 hypothetical protein HBH52_199590 [Parastagonospora nodorum]